MEQTLNGQYKDMKNGAQKNVNSFKDDVKSDISKGTTALSETFKVNAEEIGKSAEQVKERLVQLKNRAGDKAKVAAEFAKKHPLACIAGASLLGFAVGKITSRRQH